MPITINGTTGVTSPGGDTQAADTTIYGVRVGRGAGAVSTNTVVGSGAMGSNTSGNQNTVVGFQAGFSNTTSSNNTFIGRIAGYSTTTSAGNNTFVGNAVGYFNTTGQENTAIGGDALQSNTTGNLNTAIGRSAGSAITTGGKNVILGGYNGNQGGVDIRTSNNFVVISDGDGSIRELFDGTGNYIRYASYTGNQTGSWVTVCNLDTVGGTGYARGRIHASANENGNVNISYGEWYWTQSSAGPQILQIGSLVSSGNGHGQVALRVSGANLQVWNALSSSIGAWAISISVFR